MKLPVQPSSATWAWFAGLYEGQGSVVYHRSARHRARLQIRSTDEELTRLVHARIGGTVFGPYNYRYRDGIARKAFWVWVSDGLDPGDVAAEMWPWLSARRRRRFQDFSIGPQDDLPLNAGEAAVDAGLA
ncbi:MAG: hypothetical protein JOZ75_11670 [Candidatus Dormibacteraeota bacterium]|nr:hypothetical protein [Candidatus Dormibacteraeota bacterium]